MTNLRYLRLKHKIPLSELASIMGTSNQYLSRVEFEPSQRIQGTHVQYIVAMEALIQHRRERVNALDHDYRQVKDTLFQESQEVLP